MEEEPSLFLLPLPKAREASKKQNKQTKKKKKRRRAGAWV
jgi:hypothetical protein